MNVPSSVAICVAVAIVAAGVTWSDPAYAIPSPELIVGSIGSLSQLVSLLAATLGGGALVMGARSGGRAASPALRRAALGLGLLAVLSLAANAYQLLSTRQETRSRLEATLIRPTPKAKDGATLDPLLREIPYKEQLKHPLGIDTAEAETIVEAVASGDASGWRIIDIRETAETEAGSFTGAVKIRFPDLPMANVDLHGTKSLLICHNGNRSAETCAALAAKGIDCRFIRGGLEKWLSEGRPGLSARGIDDLRAIPDYANHETLLDTAAVKRLVDEEGAVFVDVRYPGEFAAQHLPGAVNLPLRSMTSDEIAARLTELRKAPVIAPCYDRRSCFFGEILGLALTRSGADFRGRYTVPWEYFVPAPRPPHVEQFLAAQQRGPLTKAADTVAVWLAWASGLIGFLPTIVIAALLSRLAVLPFSLKAERDQATARRIEPEIADIKRRFSDDPARLARALRSVYRRSGLTPLRNLMALLLLPVMAVVSMAIQTYAELHPQALLWLPSLADRDPFAVLPLLASAALTVYLQLAFALMGKRRLWLWLIAMPLLGSSLVVLGSGINVYILISAVLLLAQRTFVSGAAARWLSAFVGSRHHRRADRLLAPDIIPLSADPARLAQCGNKALHLATLKRAGLLVPDGVVLTGAFLERFRAMSSGERMRMLERHWRYLGAKTLAVRSSASAEDGAAHSFAGVFESVLDVDRAGLEQAICRVDASFNSDRVAAYGFDGGEGNVLIQRMVTPSYAGVLFTRDPGAAGYMMVELIEGCGEALVSGAATPRTFRFSRLPGAAPMVSSSAPPIDLAPLLDIGRRAERLFGAAQDVEWAYADGRFHVVQSRNIVGAGPDSEQGIVQGEWARVLGTVESEAPSTVVYTQNEMTEMMPRPTALSLSLMNDFWASGGSLDLACRRLGLNYRVEEDSDPLLTSIMGCLYVDARQAARRGPAFSALDARRLRRVAQAVDDHLTRSFLPDFQRMIALAEIADYDRLPFDRLIAELTYRRRHFVTVTHVEVDIINVLAQFYLQDAGRMLREIGRDPVVALAVHDITEPQRPLSEIAALPHEERKRAMLNGFGHRAVLDYELSQPRFSEDPSRLDTMLLAQAHASNANSNSDEAPPAKLPNAVAAAVASATRYQALKETAKHHSLRELAELRRLALALDRRLGLDGHVFQLSLDELEGAQLASAGELTRLTTERARRAAVMAEVASLPPSVTAADIAAASSGAGSTQSGDGAIAGTRVAGSRPVVGRARVISNAACERGDPIPSFNDGDIIVARMIHPAWIVYFPRAGGLVSELGGWLSHTALLARESNLPMIVAVRGIGAIPDGADISVGMSGEIELMSHLSQSLAAE